MKNFKNTKEVSALRFTHFTNKAYAIYNSLGKHIQIAVLLFVYTLLAMPYEVEAQNDTIITDRKIELNEVLVSAQRTPVTYSQAARVVTVITKEQIQGASVQSIDDLLRFAPNVDLRQRGKFGVQADVSIRGGNFDEVLILLNGINITDPQSGHHNLNLPVDIESVERIEIIEGPASRVLGPNAFSGAINFITAEGKDSYANAHVMVAEHNTQKESGSVKISTEKYTHFLTIGHQQSDGYIHNTDFNRTNLFYHGKAQLKENSLEFQLGYTSKDFGSNAFYSPKYADQYEETRTVLSSVKFSTTGKIHTSTSAYWRHNNDHYLLIREKPAVYENFHATDVAGLSFNSSFTSPIGKTAIGIDYRFETVLSNRLGTDLLNKVAIKGQTDKFYTKYDDRNLVSLFAEQNYTAGKFMASAGVMANVQTGISGINWSPGIEAAYLISDELRAVASVNTSMRMPTFTDLYYVGATNIGNIDLKPEYATNFEGGFKYGLRSLSANITAFRRLGRDMIDWTKVAVADKWQPQNLTTVNTSGVSLTTQWTPVKYDNVPWLSTIALSYTYMQQDKPAQEIISKYSLDYLKHKFNGIVEL
ncbi:MAG: hypothetical protein RIS47_11, partial [Bacteroidota bacterium]